MGSYLTREEIEEIIPKLYTFCEKKEDQLEIRILLLEEQIKNLNNEYTLLKNRLSDLNQHQL